MKGRNHQPPKFVSVLVVPVALITALIAAAPLAPLAHLPIKGAVVSIFSGQPYTPAYSQGRSASSRSLLPTAMQLLYQETGAGIAALETIIGSSRSNSRSDSPASSVGASTPAEASVSPERASAKKEGVYNPKMPEAVEVSISGTGGAAADKVCSANAISLEARVANGWPTLYSITVTVDNVLPDGRRAKVYEASGHASPSKGLEFAVENLQPGNYALTASSLTQKDQLPMSVTTPFEVVGCGGLQQVLAKEGFRIEARNGVVNIYPPQDNKLSLANVSIYVGESAEPTKVSTLFAGKLAIPVERDTPYRVEAVVSSDSNNAKLFANFEKP